MHIIQRCLYFFLLQCTNNFTGFEINAANKRPSDFLPFLTVEEQISKSTTEIKKTNKDALITRAHTHIH
jgi:hypothetical protein